MAIWKIGLRCSRERLCPQAVGADADHDTARRLRTGDLPAGRPERDHGRRRAGGRRHRPPPGRPMVSLTGDSATGKEVAQGRRRGAEARPPRAGREGAVIVFDDADPTLWRRNPKVAAFWNSGQDCTAASRVVAGPKIYDKLLEELVPAGESLQVGDPPRGRSEMGPVVSKAQRSGCSGSWSAPVARPCSAGGDANGGKGFFVRPTVITDVDQRTRSSSASLRACGYGSALRRRRPRRSPGRTTSTYGLAASVWTRDIGRALAPPAVPAVPSGSHHSTGVSEMPHGGFKHRATARTSRSTRSRTTHRSSTSWRRSTRRASRDRGDRAFREVLGRMDAPTLEEVQRA